MITFLTFAIIVGKRNNKVRAPTKQILCCECRLNLDCYSEFLVTFFSCRGRNALQSAIFWRHWPVPKSTEGSHTKLRQTVWDHSFPSRLRPRASMQVRQTITFIYEKKKKTAKKQCISDLECFLFFLLVSLGLQNQSSKLLAVNR